MSAPPRSAAPRERAASAHTRARGPYRTPWAPPQPARAPWWQRTLCWLDMHPWRVLPPSLDPWRRVAECPRCGRAWDEAHASVADMVVILTTRYRLEDEEARRG